MTIPRLAKMHWLALFAALVAGAGAKASEPAATLSDAELIRALQGGGYTIYFRHAATDWAQTDQVHAAGDWVSCDPARIRQLSGAGRDTATAVGAAMRALGIPVAGVFASPYCRTVETARLMALGEVETTTDVMNLRVAEYFGGRAAIARRARRRLSLPPAPGTNTVVVAHGNVAMLAAGMHLAEGEGAVIQPLGEQEFSTIGRLSLAQWQHAAQLLDRKSLSPP